jgi:hypothetical protein
VAFWLNWCVRCGEQAPVASAMLRGCVAVSVTLRSTGLSGRGSFLSEMLYDAEGQGVSGSVFAR